MEIYHDQKNEVAWSSWLPAMGYALAASKGPVLEIGVGHFSTPFLHEYCKSAGRKLYSVEDNYDWMGEFKHFNSETHELVIGEYNQTLNKIYAQRMGVTFIDNSPGGEGRAFPFKLYSPISDFVVVHDYWRDNEEAIGPLLKGMNFRVYKDYEPPTLLASIKHKL